VVDFLSSRRQNRRTRRNRLRYRKAWFQNREGYNKKGRLAPSIQDKVDSHIKLVEKLQALLPNTRVFVEVAGFDIQKIRNWAITGKEYQEGDQLGFRKCGSTFFSESNTPSSTAGESLKTGY